MMSWEGREKRPRGEARGFCRGHGNGTGDVVPVWGNWQPWVFLETRRHHPAEEKVTKKRKWEAHHYTATARNPHYNAYTRKQKKTRMVEITVSAEKMATPPIVWITFF